jgi:hypothetical protein
MNLFGNTKNRTLSEPFQNSQVSHRLAGSFGWCLEFKVVIDAKTKQSASQFSRRPAFQTNDTASPHIRGLCAT